jgi:hypothetical protein
MIAVMARTPRWFALVAALLAIGACSFPDVKYAEDAGDSGGAAGEAGGAGDGATGADAPQSGDASDATTYAETGTDGSTDGPLVCDFDQDKYLNAKNAQCTGGNDCCDTDKNAHPGVTAFFTTADACGSFDYNCNGKEDPQYATSLTCGGTAATGCTGGAGFLTDPGCGNSAPFYQCVGNGLLACKPGNQISQTQGCN